MTSQQHWIRQQWAMLIIVIVLVLSLGLTVTSLIGERHAVITARHAADRAQAVATCVNNVLGSRNSTTGDDSDALLQWAISLGAVLAAPSGSAVQAEQYQHFLQKDLPNLIKVYTTDKAFRAQHPLGRC